MPQHTPQRRSRQSVSDRQHCQRLLRQPGLPFAKLLPAEVVQQALQAEAVSWRDRLFTPLVTVWVFLSQILDPDHSCRQAVARFLAWLVAHGESPCSEQTGAYCRARQRLPEGVLTRLLRQTGHHREANSPSGWRWHHRRVRLVDGTTVSMPDTPANQQAYPQPRTQKPGLGFPIARLVVIFSLAVGTVLEAAMNPYKGKETGETALLRALLVQLQAEDVLVGDRCYANYWLIALAVQRGLDIVFRQHQLRRVDFRGGRRLGKDDHLITWTKPKRPPWMDAATWASLPATLTLRELRVRVPKGKFRTKEIVIVTTLRDPTRYAKSEIQALYRRRWEAETNLRAVKQILQMDVLRCKTPAMVRKEVWAHLLIYNLIRTAAAQAAEAHDVQPWQISFKGALQTVNAFGGALPLYTVLDPAAQEQAFLAAIAGHRVGNRPDRYEPRQLKRRPKCQRLLKEPRPQARARFARSGEPSR
jgi:DDE family transposase/transposase IS4-like protein